MKGFFNEPGDADPSHNPGKNKNTVNNSDLSGESDDGDVSFELDAHVNTLNDFDRCDETDTGVH